MKYKKTNFWNLIRISKKIKKGKFLIFFGPIFFILFVYTSITYNTILKERRIEAITSFLSNNDTILLKNFLLNKIKSPYLEYDYLIKEGDTIEKILKKFSIKNDQVDFIVTKIKKMKLSK